MNINWSAGYWEGGLYFLFPSSSSDRFRDHSHSSPEMEEVWGSAADWLVLDTVYQRKIVVAWKPAAAICCRPMQLPHCSSSNALSYLFAWVCYLNPPH